MQSYIYGKVLERGQNIFQSQVHPANLIERLREDLGMNAASGKTHLLLCMPPPGLYLASVGSPGFVPVPTEPRNEF